MTTKTVRFLFDECQVTGEPALIHESQTRADNYYGCTNGTLLAHDVIEHVDGPEHIGDVADEFQALGAILLVRGYQFQSVPHDVANVLREASDYDYPPHTIPAVYHVEAIRRIDNSIREGLKEAAAELEHEYSRKTERKAYAQRLASMRHTARMARHSMHIGYLRSLDTYGNRCHAGAVFASVVEATQRFADRAADFIGDTLTLTYDTESGKAWCDLGSESELDMESDE